MAQSNGVTPAAPYFSRTVECERISARVSEYGRLLASVGINGCTVNNVNADLHILGTDFIPQTGSHC